VHKSWVPSHHGNYILYGGTQHLWVHSMELASSHPSNAHKFEPALTFLENLWTLAYKYSSVYYSM